MELNNNYLTVFYTINDLNPLENGAFILDENFEPDFSDFEDVFELLERVEYQPSDKSIESILNFAKH